MSTWTDRFSYPATLLGVTLLLIVLGGTSLRSRLFHRLPEPADEYFVVARIPQARGPQRVTFRDVIVLADHSKTISFVRNYRGKYAVVKRNPGLSRDDVEREISSLLQGRVALTPLSGMWLLRRTFGEAVWLVLLGGFVLFTLRKPTRYWFYGLAVLLCWALLGVTVWAAVDSVATGMRVEWTLGGLLFLVAISAYLAASAAAAIYFWNDLRLRCRECLHRLRMPLDDGVTGSMVVDPSTEATVCIYGHGTRTVGRWQDIWTPAAGSYWDDLLRAEGYQAWK